MNTNLLRRLLSPVTLAVAGLLVVPSAHAINCYSGAVVDVAVDNVGNVWLTTTSVPLHAVCNINTKGPFTMDVNACNAAFALIVPAKASFRPLSVQYATGSCNAPGAYSAFYVQLN